MKTAYDPKTGKESHTVQAPEEHIRRLAHIQDEKPRVYAATVAAREDTVRRFLQSVRDLHLDANPFVTSLSDNGGAASFRGVKPPLAGHRFELLERAVRVLGAMPWKSRLASGRVIRQPDGVVDLFRTLCPPAGIPRPANLGGRGLIPVLFENRTFERDLFWRAERHVACPLGSRKCNRARDGQEYPFDLARDPRETNHLTGDPSALRKVQTACQEVRATVPS